MQITVANKEKSIIELIHNARVFFICFSFNKLTVTIIKYVLTKRKPETKFISSAVITEKQLEIIIRQNKKDWRAALENQKAVYLITDKNNGKLYVGSATSDYGMLLQRWSNYVENGHGGNIELKKLVEEKGFDYVKKYFQYSILENYNAKIDDHIILERESWWKDTLQSRKHGYNAN